MRHIVTEKRMDSVAFRVFYDTDVENPRHETEPLALMATWIPRSAMGDDNMPRSEEEFVDYPESSDIVKDLYMVDGYTIRLSTSPPEHTPGSPLPLRIGKTLVSRKAIERAGLNPDDTETIDRVVESELTEYALYLSGEVYGVGAHHICRNQILPRPEISATGIFGFSESAFDDAAIDLLESLPETDREGLTASMIKAADWSP